MPAAPHPFPLRSSLLALALWVPALPSQKPAPSRPGQAPAGAPAAEAPPAPADDAATAKDPVVQALDRLRKAQVNTKRADWKTTVPAPPAVRFPAGRTYFWHVVTNHGTLVVQLLPDAAPQHVASTILLSRCGFYDGLLFPRILKGFMAQSGSPTNDQSGNAGYTLDGEFLTGAKHDAAGTLSAANSGQPHSDGSQFFLTFTATPHLDGKHTVYGRTVEGLDVLAKLEACGAAKDGEPLAGVAQILRTWVRVAEAPAEAKAKPGTAGGKAPAPGGSGK
jgi:peptidylprolyl isomerase